MKYLLAALAAIIGVLVVALKLQGSKLHAAQIAMLTQQLKMQQNKDDASVAKAKAALAAAMAAYEAGGK